MIEVSALQLSMWMLTCLFSGISLGIIYATHRKRPTSSFSVSKELKNMHVGTITVEVRLGWRFRLRSMLTLWLCKLGSAVAPYRLDVERA